MRRRRRRRAALRVQNEDPKQKLRRVGSNHDGGTGSGESQLALCEDASCPPIVVSPFLR